MPQLFIFDSWIKRWHSLLTNSLKISYLLTYIIIIKGFNPEDGITYHYKGNRIHRVLRGQFFQSGDLLDQKGLCSRSVMNDGGLFKDENFVLR